MEKITAYKAFNGRLFDSEEKCLAYEKKHSEYPKVKETINVALPRYSVNDGYIPVPIDKFTKETWKTPSSQKKTEVYYIVCNKYKFTPLSVNLDCELMGGCVFDAERPTTNWYNVARYFAELIILGNELTDEFITRKIDELNNMNRPSTYPKESLYTTDFVAYVMEQGKVWKIDNPSWQRGVIAPHTFLIEKL